MRSLRDQLQELGEERSEWVRMTTKEIQSGEKKVSYSGRSQFTQVNMGLYYEITRYVGSSGNAIANKMLDEMYYVTNIYTGTYEEIGESTELSSATVIRAMAKLQSVDFIRKYRNGRWMINPEVAIKCSFDKFDALLSKYTSLKKENPIITGGTEDEN